MSKFRFFTLTIAAFTLTACGEFNSSDSKKEVSAAGTSLVRKPFGTCDRKSVSTINLCMEAVGSDYNEPGYLGILKSSCESSGGIYSTGNCAPANSFGTCIVNAGQANLTFVSYYPPQYTLESAQAACAATAGGNYTLH